MTAYRSLTLQGGIYKQVQDADTLIVGGGVTTAAGVNLTIAAGAGGAIQITGAAVLSGGFTASGATDWDWSGSSGQFKTSTGAVQLSGTTTLAANKNLLCAAGTSQLDFSLGTGIFKSPSGANTLLGAVTLGDATHTAVGMSMVAASTGNIDFGNSSGTFDTPTGAADLNGTTTLAANKNLLCAAGTSQLDFSLGTGIFKSPSGANTLLGAVTLGDATHLGVGLAMVASSTGNIDFSASTGTFKAPTGAATFGGTTNTFTNAIIANGGIQRVAASAGSIEIGTDANTTALNIGSTGVLTTIHGDLTVDGIETVIGTSEFQDDATFKGDVTFGDAATDTVAFLSGIGPSGTQDFNFIKELAHVIRVTTSTTAVTAGGALSIYSGTGNGAAGGALTIDTGTGSVGGALTLGGNNAASVGVGRSGITTTITGTSISLAGNTTLTANSNLSCAAGTTAADFSLGTGVFKSTTGANTLLGAVTLGDATHTAVGLSMVAASTGNIDFGNSSGTFDTPTGAADLNGTTTLAANKNLLCAAGTSQLDFSLGTGIFKTSTGAVTIGGGANAIGITSSGAAITITAGAASTWKTTAGALTIEGFVGINLNGDPADTYMDLGVTTANVITVTAGHTFDSTAATATKINTGTALWFGAVQCTANVTGTNLNELTGGGATTLHSHAAAGNVAITVLAGEAINGDAPVTMANAAGVAKAYEGDANGAGTRANVIGVAPTAGIGSGSSGAVAVCGEVAVADARWDAVPAVADVGSPFYLSETVGKWTITAPSTAGSTVLRCGYVTRGGAGAVKVAIVIGNGVVL